MAINLDNVKAIVHNNKDVIKIEDSNGNTIWQATSTKELDYITLSGYTSTLDRDDTYVYGGTVTASYTDGSTADVTNSTTFSGYNMSLGGTYTVTASYTEDNITKTATYSLTVNKLWSDIWTGSKTVKQVGSTTTGSSSNFASTVNGTGSTPRIRIKFSTLSGTGGSGSPTNSYYNNNTLGSTKPTSPLTITVSNGDSRKLLGVYRNLQYTGSEQVNLVSNRDTTNSRIRFSLAGSYTDSLGSTCTLTITKIEQYY